MAMSIVCEQCDDVGRETELILCAECFESARHTYCMFINTYRHYPEHFFAPDWICRRCKSDSDSDESSNKHHPRAAAEPVLLPAWSGSFDMYHEDDNIKLDGVHAFLSSKASRRVRHAATNEFCNTLLLEVQPTRVVWPHSFTDDDIGVYFLPSIEKESAYDCLLMEMIMGDLAMSTCLLGDAELLVFPSTVLPSDSWRLQGKLYLWGLFKGKLQQEQDDDI